MFRWWFMELLLCAVAHRQWSTLGQPWFGCPAPSLGWGNVCPAPCPGWGNVCPAPCPGWGKPLWPCPGEAGLGWLPSPHAQTQPLQTEQLVQQCPKTVPSAGFLFFLNLWESKYYSLCCAFNIFHIIVFYLHSPVAYLRHLSCADNSGQGFHVVPLPMATQTPGSLFILLDKAVFVPFSPFSEVWRLKVYRW